MQVQNAAAQPSSSRRLVQVIQKLGTLTGLKYVIGKRLQGKKGSTWTLKPKRAGSPLHLRTASSDIEVFYQIFVEQEYQVLDDLRNVDLIIDGGANVGYSAAWFLSTFPECHVVAVEPDPQNYQVLARNMEPYGPRVELVQAGIWSRSARLKIANPTEAHWGRQVTECADGEPGGMPSVGIDDLLARSRRSRISILKLDIEGAETMLFKSGYEGWIDKIDTLVVELHHHSPWGDADDAFRQAIDGRDVSVSRSGELTIARFGSSNKR